LSASYSQSITDAFFGVQIVLQNVIIMSVFALLLDRTLAHLAIFQIDLAVTSEAHIYIYFSLLMWYRVFVDSLFIFPAQAVLGASVGDQG